MSPPEEPCCYCGSQDAKSIDIEQLEPLFRPVVVEHYVSYDDLSQYRHVPPDSGDDLYWLIQGDYGPFSEDVDEPNDLLFAILDSARSYKDPIVFDKDSYWFHKEDDWGHMSNEEFNDTAWGYLQKAISVHGHGLVTLKANDRLDKEVALAYDDILRELTYSSADVDKTEVIWRARVGRWNKPENIAAPPAHKAVAGRCNLQGQPVLYVSSDRDTAISEVRPAKEDTVTVAKFKFRRDVKVCDLLDKPRGTSPFGDFNKHLRESRKTAIALSLGRILGRPVRPRDEPKEYLESQVLCRMIFDKGFDGIRYPSSQADDGVNMVFLEHDIAEPIKDSLKKVKVLNVHYDLKSKKASRSKASA